jgi:replicative DNA helicase
MSFAESQVLNKILATGDMSLIVNNGITEEIFHTYKAEFDYIWTTYREYGCAPDKASFLMKFPNFDLFNEEDAKAPVDRFLLDGLKEAHVFSELADAIGKSTDIINQNSYQGLEFLQNKLNQIQTQIGINCVDIIKTAYERLKLHQQKCIEDKGAFSIPSGFAELDRITNAWQRGEEFVVVMARTGIGKSWFLIASAEAAWKNGYNVGFISPEMTATSVGYRFDTVHNHFSNTNLTFGKKEHNYNEAYVQELQKQSNGFFVATPRDFGNKVTVSKLKAFCEVNKVDILFVDGISYLSDERANRNDSRTMELTHISEDLMELSNVLKIPILTVVQANRAATANKEEAPDLESIRDSDGIGYNASRVLSMRQAGDKTVEICLRKNRYGFSGGKLSFNWDAEHGSFKYLPSEDDALAYYRDKEDERNTARQDEISRAPLIGIVQSGFESQPCFDNVF